MRQTIRQLQYELNQIDEALSREQRMQTSRLREEHEQWAPLVQDAKSRLGTSSNAIDELNALEEEENQGRAAIRLEFKQRSEVLLEKRAATKDQLARQRSLLASVRKVDEDALIQIFDYFVNAGGSPWALAHTCSRWRGVVLSSHHLWSGILITTNVEAEVVRRREGKEVCNSLGQLRRAIRRVGDAPIDLSISFNWSHTALDVESAAAMIIAVAKTCSQWRTLHVENSEKVIDGDYIFPPNLFDKGLSNLTRVSFHMQHNNHGRRSRGLLPFGGLINAIEKTSEKLRSLHFHGYGHNELTDSYFSSPLKVEDLSLVHLEPRYIRKAHSALINACPTSRVGWRYATFIGVDDMNPAAAREGSMGFIVPHRRIAVHGNIHEALRETTANDLRILDIITTSALTLSRPLHLPYVYQLSVYSEDLEDLRFINAPILDNFRIALTSKEIHHVHASHLALERLWARGTTPHPVRVSLEGVALTYESLRRMAVHNQRLKHVKLVNVVFERQGALLGLAEAALLSLEIIFTDILDASRLEKLCQDIRSVMLARKGSEDELKRIALLHGSEEEIFDPTSI
jgi:hypothetical protein